MILTVFTEMPFVQ